MCHRWRGRGRIRETVSVARNRTSREIEGPALARTDDLDAGRITIDGLLADRGGEGRHGSFSIVFQQLHETVDGVARDLRLVALDIDDDPGSVDHGGDF